jgi:hypothetical protein
MQSCEVLNKKIYENLITIYDATPHPNELCQKIKMDWVKHCDRLNRNKLSNGIVLFKSLEQCNKIFDSYYSCYINNFNQSQ